MWETFFVVIRSDSSTTGSTFTITVQYTLVCCLGVREIQTSEQEIQTSKQGLTDKTDEESVLSLNRG